MTSTFFFSFFVGPKLARRSSRAGQDGPGLFGGPMQVHEVEKLKEKFVIIAYTQEGREVVGEYPSGRNAPGAPRYKGGGGERWSKYQEILQDWLLEHKAVAYGEVYADEEGKLVFVFYSVE